MNGKIQCFDIFRRKLCRFSIYAISIHSLIKPVWTSSIASNTHFLSSFDMEKDVREKITIDQWSPQQICGEAKLKGLSMVSHERIYQFIRKDKANGSRF